MRFASEQELVDFFAQIISSQRTSLPRMNVHYEFSFMGGKTDIVGVSKGRTVHCFEAKLRKWRECLQQAYRNTSFSHYSYVLLPQEAVTNALKSQKEFKKRGVGLCSIEAGEIKLHIRPRKQAPLQPWLTQKALELGSYEG